jgi:ABC-type sugar transport system ATPase subunit
MSVATSDTPVLKLLNVESAYGPIKAIRGVSLQVRRSEIATVLGSNGAGKTTILKTISGIIDPRKGSIEFKGENITAQDPAHIVQQGLSHVPEGREVFPLLSVRDNLLMGAYTRKDRDGVARDMEAVFTYFPILRERAALKAQGRALGPALLFYGCRHPDQDYIYEDELKEQADAGIVDLDVAFSRHDGKKTYVQDLLKEKAEKVSALIDQGAIVYVCGDGGRMEPDVKRALIAMHREKTGADEAAGEAWMAKLADDNRYVLDVWASS